MKICICDDNAADLRLIQELLEKLLKKEELTYEIETFSDGNKLMKKILEPVEYDVVFLDIDMPGIDGITIARKLHEINNVINIIFITNHAELVFEAIHYRPFRFIRKEKLHEELDEAVTAVVKKISQEMLICDFGVGKDKPRIKLADIMYIESKGHYIHIHAGEDTYELRGKISEYEEKLGNYGFIRIHLGFLVNVRFIHSITSKAVTLDNMENLPISRKNAEKIKQIHANYVRKYVRGIE